MDKDWQIVDLDGRQQRVAMVKDGGTTWVFSEGNTFTISEESRGGSRAKARGAGSVMSPMPATVVSINTTIGATANEGDTLIVLEAMKMELPIKAPRTGTVKAINCTKGELVQPGINLIEID